MQDFQLILIEYFKKIGKSENEKEYYKRFYDYCYYDCFGSCDLCPISADCNYYDPDHIGVDEDVETETLFNFI